MSRYGHITRCECGRPATRITPTGKVCARCYKIDQMMSANEERWHKGICGLPDRAEYDGHNRREWRWGGVDFDLIQSY